jgi:hypothetical protein
VTFHLFLIFTAAAVLWIGSLYVKPFGACPRGHGQRHVMRGSRNRPRPVTCPRCNGIGRRQRPGSKTVHRLVRRVERELACQRKERSL